MGFDNEKMTVGIGFATGRKNFIEVLKYNFKNWEENGLTNNPNISLNVFIAYDLIYNNIDEKEFLNVPKEIKRGLNSITFIGENEVKEILKYSKNKLNIPNKDSKLIFGTHGYGKLRNSILYYALKNNMDYLLFLDDDEYPIVPVKKENGEIEWIKQSNLLTHLKYIKNCSITSGYHCGYISPIPYFEIGKEIKEDVFKDFIEAISNDIINWDKMKNLIMQNKGVTYGDLEIINNKKTIEIMFLNGGKWIASSNLCLNLKRLKKAYPFYNPPNARGEDTFLATCLKEEKVLRVPTYSFHDGFLRYTSILENKFPNKLYKIESEDEVVKQRFLKACLGWTRYKPLLLYVTDRKNYSKSIDEVYRKLNNSLPDICSVLKINDFYEMKEELNTYNSQVRNHYNEFMQVKKMWNKIFNNLRKEKIRKENEVLEKTIIKENISASVFGNIALQ
ncbi:MAG: hypothetical protein FWF46_02565 [Oscillospiraceae bacterium]|nr:hypothetical protein [Oscillospiraceae bacterium]